jgi:hypothetical protein
MLRPLDPDDEETEVVSARRIIPVTHAYMHQFLFQTLTPAQAWNQISMQMVADGREDDYSALLNFLRMTLIDKLGQRRNDPNALPQVAVIDNVIPPLGDAIFFGHLPRKLRTLLPGATMPPTPNAVLQQVILGQNLLQQTLQDAMLENQVASFYESSARGNWIYFCRHGHQNLNYHHLLLQNICKTPLFVLSLCTSAYGSTW